MITGRAEAQPSRRNRGEGTGTANSRGFDTARLCDDEVRLQHYHDWLDYIMKTG